MGMIRSSPPRPPRTEVHVVVRRRCDLHADETHICDLFHLPQRGEATEEVDAAHADQPIGELGHLARHELGRHVGVQMRHLDRVTNSYVDGCFVHTGDHLFAAHTLVQARLLTDLGPTSSDHRVVHHGQVTPTVRLRQPNVGVNNHGYSPFNRLRVLCPDRERRCRAAFRIPSSHGRHVAGRPCE